MKKIRLGSAGPDITRIGLGTWAIGGPGWQFAWGAQDDADSIAAIRRAIDLGINWIDTAVVYGHGHSEEMVGRAIEGRREGVLVATKCGRVLDPNGTIAHRLRADSVRRELEASLRRLRTDRIDLYQIHWPQPDEELEEGWAEIAKAVREGKVRWAGVSNFNVEQLKRVQAIHPVTSLQPPLSILRRGVEQDLLPYCAANGIGVICYSPMQAGLLTGAFTRERAAALPADDWRRNSPFFKEPELSANLAVVDGLRVIAARRGCSVGELAIAWVLRRPGVTGAIVGARRPDQIEGTIGAADLYLTEAELAEIETLLAERERTLKGSQI
ncbi:MAG: aldo/keto reductase [Spirochaetes bacterium RBG_13_68_11]|nr:MAG: aldo/keto reductase [Spirochaetes bacterium RBG_13_68_11]